MMKISPKSLLAASALSLALAATGCGSSSGDRTYSVRADTTMTVGSIDRADFVAQTNRTCRAAWRTIFDNFLIYSGTQDSHEGVVRRYAEAIRLSLLAGIDFHIFDAIYRSKAPHGERARVEKIIGAMQSAVEQGEKGLVPMRTPAQAVARFSEYNRLARSYGLDSCLVRGARLRELKRRTAAG